MATTPGMVWLAEATDNGQPGYLQGISSVTGAPVRSWRVGSQPVALATAGQHLWIVDAVAPNAYQPNLVIDSDLAGHRSHTYAIANPVSVAADGTGAWIGSTTGGQPLLTRVGNGKIGRRVALPGVSADGNVPVIACSQAIFAITTDATVGTHAMLVSSVASDGTISAYGKISASGVTHLACQPSGLLAETAGDTVQLFKLTAGTASTQKSVAAKTGLIVASTDRAWLLTGAAQIDYSSLSLVDPAALTLGQALSLPGDVVAAVSNDQGQLWVVTNNVQGSQRPVLTEVGAS